MQTQTRSFKLSAFFSPWSVRETEASGDNSSMTHIWAWLRQTGRDPLCKEGYSWLQLKEGKKNGGRGRGSRDHPLTQNIHLQTFPTPKVGKISHSWEQRQNKTTWHQHLTNGFSSRKTIFASTCTQFPLLPPLSLCVQAWQDATGWERSRSSSKNLAGRRGSSDTLQAESESDSTVESPGGHLTVWSALVSRQCVSVWLKRCRVINLVSRLLSA